MKQQVQNILRKSGLMPIADDFRFVLDKTKKLSKNTKYKNDNPGEIYPPDYMMYEIFGTVDYFHFFRSGKKAAGNLAELYKRNSNQKPDSILEWGCGIARVTRHLDDFDIFKGSDIWGSDINSKMINWNKNNIKNINFKTNEVEPPLNFDDNSFDLVYSTSVFTHLSRSLQKDWMDDIVRVLKPNGLFIFTTHGDYYAKNKLSESEFNLYKNDGIVVRANAKEGSRVMATFNSPKYMKEILLKNLSIMEHIPEHELELAGYQDIWIIKK